jgi:hypothetical protein
MASIITATTSSGLTQSADNSGVLQLASGVGNLVTVPSVTGTAMVSGNMPAFAVYLAANQSVTTATWTKVTLNTEEFDTNTNFDSATNYRFTPTVSGYYLISGAVAGSGTANTQTACTCAIYKNGTIYKQGSGWNSNSAVTATMNASVSAVIFFNGTTDYVELFGFNTQTSPVFAGGISQTYLTGSMVRAA